MRANAQGMVVVITGASRGIGRATARRFAERGASVVLAARSEQAPPQAAAGRGARRGRGGGGVGERGAAVVRGGRWGEGLVEAAAEGEALGGEALAVPTDVAEW